MKTFLAGMLAMLSLIAAGAGFVIYTGRVDVSADTPHSAPVFALIETARDRAIARRIGDLDVPGNLDDAERIRRGSGNYDAMCVACHLKPGMADSEIRKGLYPQPPDLTQAAEQPEEAMTARAARDFWVIKHGIKASGMPAWAQGGIEDDAIWDMVAFVGRLPTLSPDAYRTLVEASDGHSHGGMEAPGASPKAKASAHDDEHDHSGHAH